MEITIPEHVHDYAEREHLHPEHSHEHDHPEHATIIADIRADLGEVKGMLLRLTAEPPQVTEDLTEPVVGNLPPPPPVSTTIELPADAVEDKEEDKKEPKKERRRGKKHRL